MIYFKNILIMKKVFKYLLVVIWMVLIFYLSNQSGYISGNESSNIIYNTLNFFYKLFHISNVNLNDIVNIIHNPIREVMHFLEYFILALLLINALGKKYIEIFMICFIYSITDEIHQLYVPNRSFQYLDLIIDGLGYISIIIFLTINKFHKK